MSYSFLGGFVLCILEFIVGVGIYKRLEYGFRMNKDIRNWGLGRVIRS